MEKRLILEIDVTIEPAAISRLTGPGGEVVSIPFGGTARGEIFRGEICPGACDVQTVNLSGVRHMCARYMLRGEDGEGRPCRIFIENNGWFQDPMAPGVPLLDGQRRIGPLSAPPRLCRRGRPPPGGTGHQVLRGFVIFAQTSNIPDMVGDVFYHRMKPPPRTRSPS